MTLFLISAGVIAVLMLMMAVGVIFKNRCLRGSCGGPEIFDSKGVPLSCFACPRRKEHEEQQRSSGVEESSCPVPSASVDNR